MTDAAPRVAQIARPAARRAFVTPEGVDLGLQIGEASERAAAFLIDAAIIAAGLVGFTIAVAFAAGAANTSAREMVMVVWLLGSFLARNVYFIAFELGGRAATPGKRMMGLRVAARHGGRLTADAIFARNAMRELEVYLPLSVLLSGGQDVDAWLKLLGVIWCGVFVLFPLFNRDRLRVGDLVAGTWVVKSPKTRLLSDLMEARAYDPDLFAFTQAQVDAYGVKELHVLEEVIRRKSLATTTAVADRIRRKIGWTRASDESDGAFLEAYYAALRRRLETRLLFGRRRKDKFDVG